MSDNPIICSAKKGVSEGTPYCRVIVTNKNERMKTKTGTYKELSIMIDISSGKDHTWDTADDTIYIHNGKNVYIPRDVIKKSLDFIKSGSKEETIEIKDYDSSKMFAITKTTDIVSLHAWSITMLEEAPFDSLEPLGISKNITKLVSRALDCDRVSPDKKNLLKSKIYEIQNATNHEEKQKLIKELKTEAINVYHYMINGLNIKPDWKTLGLKEDEQSLRELGLPGNLPSMLAYCLKCTDFKDIELYKNNLRIVILKLQEATDYNEKQEIIKSLTTMTRKLYIDITNLKSRPSTDSKNAEKIMQQITKAVGGCGGTDNLLLKCIIVEGDHGDGKYYDFQHLGIIGSNVSYILANYQRDNQDLLEVIWDECINGGWNDGWVVTATYDQIFSALEARANALCIKLPDHLLADYRNKRRYIDSDGNADDKKYKDAAEALRKVFWSLMHAEYRNLSEAQEVGWSEYEPCRVLYR